jgi:hypothetical protein
MFGKDLGSLDNYHRCRRSITWIGSQKSMAHGMDSEPVKHLNAFDRSESELLAYGKLIPAVYITDRVQDEQAGIASERQSSFCLLTLAQAYAFDAVRNTSK